MSLELASDISETCFRLFIRAQTKRRGSWLGGPSSIPEFEFRNPWLGFMAVYSLSVRTLRQCLKTVHVRLCTSAYFRLHFRNRPPILRKRTNAVKKVSLKTYNRVEKPRKTPDGV
jgi:hypothetical protein